MRSRASASRDASMPRSRSSSARVAAASGGGGRRNWPPEESTQVRQAPAPGSARSAASGWWAPAAPAKARAAPMSNAAPAARRRTRVKQAMTSPCAPDRPGSQGSLISRGEKACDAPHTTGAGVEAPLGHRLLQVLVDLRQEGLGVQPGLVLADQDRQVLGHLAALDGLDANPLKRLGEGGDVRRVVEFTAVGQAARPGEDGSDRVGRGLAAFLVLAV